MPLIPISFEIEAIQSGMSARNDSFEIGALWVCPELGPSSKGKSFYPFGNNS